MDEKKKRFIILGAGLAVLAVAASSALGRNTKDDEQEQRQLRALAERGAAAPAGDVLDTDDVLIRLASYEQRILSLEQDEKPSLMVPTADALSSYHGGEKVASVEDRIAESRSVPKDSVSLAEYTTIKKQLKQRISELETALQASEELIVELKKVRPSTAQLQAFEEERAKNSEIITKLTERISELERALEQPQVRNLGDADSRAKEELALAQQEILKLTDQRNRLIDRLRSMKNESSQHRAATRSEQEVVARLQGELRQAVDEGKSARDQIRALERQLGDYERLQREMALNNEKLSSLESANAQLKAEIGRLGTASENNAYLRKELEAAQNELKELRIEDRSKTAKLNTLSSKASRLAPELEKALAEKAELKERNSKLQAHLAELTSRQDGFEKSLATLRSENSKLTESSSRAEEQLSTVQGWVKSLRAEKEQLEADKKELTTKLEQATDLLKSLKDEREQHAKILSSKEEELQNINRQLSRAIQDTKELKTSLTAKEEELAKIPQLERELIDARNELLLKDTELARLGSSGSAGAELAAISAPEPRPAEGLKPRSGSEVLIVEVIPAKVNLRVGPGREHSPLLQIRKGSRLTVEHRQGDWYRVMTPEGKRAYIRTDVVRPVNAPPAAAAGARGKLKDLEPFGTVAPRGDEDASAGQGADEETQALDYLRSAIQRR